MVRLLIYSICLLISSTALSGAWLQEPGKSELISQYEHQKITTNYTSPLKKQPPVNKTSSFDIYNILLQYGFNEKLTLGFETKWYNYNGSINLNSNYNNNILLKNSPEQNYNFFDEHETRNKNIHKRLENSPLETRFFAQTELYSSENSVFSIQPSINFYTNSLDKALELRALYGYNFKLGSKHSYFNCELAAIRNTHQFTSKNIDSTTLKLDFTLGFSLKRNHTIMLQNFYYYNHGLYGNNYSSVGQASWLYHYNKNLSWQTGYATNFTNRNQYISQSVITGIWLKF